MATSNRFNSQAVIKPAQHTALLVEHLLSLIRLPGTPNGADVFRSEGPLLCPPWARGVYGGQLVAQALLAAYETVPARFVVHSIHCHFLSAAEVDGRPLVYEVQRLRDSKSFATRTVHAKQNDDRLVLSATVSFGRHDRPHVRDSLCHDTPMPADEQPPGDELKAVQQSAAGQAGENQPCDCVRVPVSQNKGTPSERKLRQWIRARRQGPGTEGESHRPGEDSHSAMTLGGATRGSGQGLPSRDAEDDDNNGNDTHRTHVAALAYMSDNYFIGTVFRVHNASRFSNLASPHPMLASAAGREHGHDAGKTLKAYFAALAREEMDDNMDAPNNGARVDMMVTLNHTIFFHNPRHLRADEWLLAEMESPWAGDERGVVLQRLWSWQGTLIATCIQEGLVKLSQRAGNGKL